MYDLQGSKQQSSVLTALPGRYLMPKFPAKEGEKKENRKVKGAGAAGKRRKGKRGEIRRERKRDCIEQCSRESNLGRKEVLVYIP